MKTIKLLPLFLAAVLAASIVTAGADQSGDSLLRTNKMKVTNRPDGRGGAPRDSLMVKGRVGAIDLPSPLAPETREIEVRLGQNTVLSFEPGDGTVWREKGFSRAKAKASGTAGCPGKAIFVLKKTTGEFRIKASRMDLDRVMNQGPDGLEVRIRIGEAEFAEILDLEQKGERWGYTAPLSVRTKGGWTSGPDNSGTSRIQNRTLIQGMRASVTTGVWPSGTVIKNQSDYQYVWSKLIWGMHPPYVNFQTEMVILMCNPGSRYTMLDLVLEPGDNLRVRWKTEDTPPKYCPQSGCLKNEVFKVIAVRKITGTVTFERVN